MEGKKIRTPNLILIFLSLTRFFTRGCEPVSELENKSVDLTGDFKGTILARIEDMSKRQCNKACCDRENENCVIALYEKENAKQCTLLACSPVGACPIINIEGSFLTFFGEVHGAASPSPQTDTTTDRSTTTKASTTQLPTDSADNTTNTDENTSTKVSTNKLTTGNTETSSNTHKTGSTSEQSTTVTSTYVSTSPPSTPVSSPTLLSGTLTSSTASLPSLTTTHSSTNTATGSSTPTSTSIILTAISTALSTGENTQVSANETAVSALNETRENITNAPEIEENKITVENNTLETVGQNVSTTSKVNTNPELDNETTALVSEEISQPATSTISETISPKSSTLPSTSISFTLWPFNFSSVSTILTSSLSSLSTQSSANTSSSALSTSTSVSSPKTHSTATNESSATSSATTTSSSQRSSEANTLSTTASSSVETVSVSFWTSPLTPISSSTSGHNETSHRKLSGSRETDQMSGTLIVALCIGIVLTFTVAVLFGKRVFDAWQRRHYNKLDYLINGMYG